MIISRRRLIRLELEQKKYVLFVRHLTASLSLSSPRFHLHTEGVCCFEYSTRFQSEYLRCVQHVDENSESNKCGFVPWLS